MTSTKLDSFTLAYIEAALWSSTDESDDSGGEPLDANYDIDDIHPETLAKMIGDCAAFQRDNAADIATWEGRGDADEQGGHDFWLTRNGHGAGFWESEWDDGHGAGDRLDSAASAFGTFDLYIGDDGLIHGS